MPKIVRNETEFCTGPSTLAGLGDTNISNPENDQILQYNGTKWANTNVFKDLQSKHLVQAGTYTVTVKNQYQTVIIIGYVNGENVFYTFMASSPTTTVGVYGTNRLSITKISNVSFQIVVGGSTDFYILADLVSIS